MIPMRCRNSETFNYRPVFTGILPLFVLANFAHHLVTVLLTPLLPMIRTHFSLNYIQSGLLPSTFAISYALGQLPAGLLADRLGPRLVITMGICGVAVSGFLIGVSSTYIMMITFLILMGLLGGGYHPSAPPLISASVEPKSLGRALGFHVLGGNASLFLTPLIAVAIAAVWGWRGSFIVLAIPTLVFGILFYILLGRLDTSKNGKIEMYESRNETKPVQGFNSRLLVIIVLGAFTSATLISTIFFIPLMLVDKFGVSEGTAASLVSLIFFAGLWAAPISGYLSDRLGKIPVVISLCFLAGPVVWLISLFSYGTGTWLMLLALGVSLSGRTPVIESFVVSQTSVSNRSTIFGIYYFSAMEGGGILMPVIGYFIDKIGFYASFSIIGTALFLTTLICSFWLWGDFE